MTSDRSNTQLTTEDLKELLIGSKKRIDEYFVSGNGVDWLKLYDIRNPLCIALCQGAAMHFHDKKNGIKDFDIWFFYPFAYSGARLPPIPWESCHLIHGKVATHSTAKLPPIPWQGCHPR